MEYANIILFFAFLALGYGVGTYLEKRHYRDIEAREKAYLNIPIVTMEETVGYEQEVASANLVSGSVVISIDYFKRILSGLQMFVGGRVTAYETLVDRARREAILRMIENSHGADIIENVRVETSAIGQSANRKQAVGSVEALAYGTAIKLR
ncbi:MAG: heavy metal-binding domain-containing protein [Desulfatibacillum sp.]|nr:heavy metal-binding domain-containing protein [Desulfatibacillum sp.]